MDSRIYLSPSFLSGVFYRAWMSVDRSLVVGGKAQLSCLTDLFREVLKMSMRNLKNG